MPGQCLRIYEWACLGVGRRAGPPPHFPELRLRHAAPHVAASRPRGDLARGQPVSCFGWGLGGCRPESPPRRRQATRLAGDTPPGALRGLSALAPPSRFWKGSLKQEAAS